MTKREIPQPDVPETSSEEIGDSPGSERETEVLQADQEGSPAFDDPDIDRSAIKLLPGTGDYTDDGDVEVDPAEVHMPRMPNSDSAAPGADA